MKLFQAIIVLVVIVFTTFIPSLKNDFTNWDDHAYVTENPLLQDFSSDGINKIITTPVAANHHPLTMLSLAFNYKISGLKAFSYHLLNLLLHLLNTALVFYFIYKLSQNNIEVAFITALLFGIHPMHVESVAWVAARKDVLFTVFFMSGLIAYLHYMKSHKITSYLVTVFLFILSLLAKPAAIIFPFILMLIDYYYSRKITIKAIGEKIPFFALAVAAGLITLSIQASAGALGDKPIYSILQRALFASHSLVMYFIKAIIPFQLSAFHPYPSVESMPLMFYIAPILIVAFSALIVYYFRKNRIVVFGMLFFLINLIMVLQFLSFGNAIMAERYTYLPYIGLFFIVGSGYSYIAKAKEKNISKWKNIFAGFIIFFSFIMCVITYDRVDVWKNSESLWSDVVEKYPKHSTGWYNRGHYLSENQQYVKAIDDYSMAIATRKNYYEAYYNRAQGYRLTGKNKEALADYTQAIKIKPEEVNSYTSRGLAYSNLNLIDSAIADYNKAVVLAPQNYNVWFGRGNMLFFKKEFSKAIVDYNKTIELAPSYSEGYYNRAVAYGNLGDKKKSMQDLLKSQELGHKPEPALMEWLKK